MKRLVEGPISKHLFRYVPRLDELERREAPSLLFLDTLGDEIGVRGRANAPRSISVMRTFLTENQPSQEDLSWLDSDVSASTPSQPRADTGFSVALPGTFQGDVQVENLFPSSQPGLRPLAAPVDAGQALAAVAGTFQDVGAPTNGRAPAAGETTPPAADMENSIQAIWNAVNAGLLSQFGGEGGQGPSAQGGIIEETWINNSTQLGQATGIAWAPDGSNRMFVTRKAGQVRIIENGQLLATPFATITPIVTTSECGLIGLAFDPNYAVNRYVYFFVTVATNEQQIIRYTDNNNIGTNKTTIKNGLPTRGANHDGGGVGFGLDGKLYWSVGDLGNGTGVNEDLTTLAAKIGRANRDGSVPGDNPYHDGAGPNNDYIWAIGHRNPFTFTIQPTTQQLWVNTVGTRYEQVFVVSAGSHAGYNRYEINQPVEQGFMAPVLKYRTNGTDAVSITSASRENGVATFTTTALAAGRCGTFACLGNNFFLGERLTISGVGDASFNGSYSISEIVDSTTFRVVQAGADAASSGGSATTLNIGGCLTGGSFYNSNLLPDDYFNNYFFTDCNTGRVIRTTLDENTNNISSYDYFSRPQTNSGIDTATGPDGALYVLFHGGQIYRYSYAQAEQKIVVSPRVQILDEDGQAAYSVSLAVQPAQDVTVSVFFLVGSGDSITTTTTELTFTPANWNVPQGVNLVSTADANAELDWAIFLNYAPDLAPEWAFAFARDDQF